MLLTHRTERKTIHSVRCKINPETIPDLSLALGPKNPRSTARSRDASLRLRLHTNIRLLHTPILSRSSHRCSGPDSSPHYGSSVKSTLQRREVWRWVRGNWAVHLTQCTLPSLPPPALNKTSPIVTRESFSASALKMGQLTSFWSYAPMRKPEKNWQRIGGAFNGRYGSITRQREA